MAHPQLPVAVSALNAFHCSEQDRKNLRGAISNGAAFSFLSRVSISRSLLDELVAAAPKNDHGKRILKGFDATGAIFEDGVDFGESDFPDEARFAGARFEGNASFHNTEFFGPVRFEGAEFAGDVSFEWAAFRFPAVLELHTPGVVDLNNARFSETALLDVRASRLIMRRTEFLRQATLRVDGGDIDLSFTEFGGSANLIESPEKNPARILDTRGTTVGRLRLANIDLRACRFDGAYQLDGLRIEGASQFPRTPAYGRLTPRTIIAEEHMLRTVLLRDRRWGVLPVESLWPSDIEEVQLLKPASIQTTYRALRKSREDAKDEPGAADFYYGEMEMRRLGLGHGFAPAGTRPVADLQRATERTLLWLYWVLSGYGTRAWRALLGLVVTVMAFGLAFHSFGFTDDRAWYESMRFAAASVTALLRGPQEENLTETGEWMRLVLRVMGPVFIGLAFFSLRARVKR